MAKKKLNKIKLDKHIDKTAYSNALMLNSGSPVGVIVKAVGFPTGKKSDGHSYALVRIGNNELYFDKNSEGLETLEYLIGMLNDARSVLEDVRLEDYADDN